MNTTSLEAVHWLPRIPKRLQYTLPDRVKNTAFPLKITMSISESDITRRLVKILTQVFGLRADQITPELTKEGVSSWDSLKQMDLVMSVEREFGISLEINDIVRMDSVANIVAVLQDKGADLGD